MNRLINSINCVSFGTINTSDKVLSRRNNSATLWQHLTVINPTKQIASVLSTYSKWALYKLCTSASGHNWLRENLSCCYIPTFCWRALHLSLTRGRLLQRQEGEDSVSLGALQTHFHRLVLLHGRADVPVAVGDRHQGAEVDPSDVLVEEKANQFAVRADGAQLLLVFHCLWEEKIQMKRFNSRKEERRRRAHPPSRLFKSFKTEDLSLL